MVELATQFASSVKDFFGRNDKYEFLFIFIYFFVTLVIVLNILHGVYFFTTLAVVEKSILDFYGIAFTF